MNRRSRREGDNPCKAAAHSRCLTNAVPFPIHEHRAARRRGASRGRGRQGQPRGRGVAGHQLSTCPLPAPGERGQGRREGGSWRREGAPRSEEAGELVCRWGTRTLYLGGERAEGKEGARGGGPCRGWRSRGGSGREEPGRGEGTGGRRGRLRAGIRRHSEGRRDRGRSGWGGVLIAWHTVGAP